MRDSRWTLIDKGENARECWTVAVRRVGRSTVALSKTRAAGAAVKRRGIERGESGGADAGSTRRLPREWREAGSHRVPAPWTSSRFELRRLP